MFTRCKTFFALFLMILAPLFLQAEWVPGLRGGYIETTFDETNFPAVENIYLDPCAATNNCIDANKPSLWAPYRTWIFHGQMFMDGGSYYFAEKMNDITQLKIDGDIVLLSLKWEDFQASEKLQFTRGWHDIEIRFGHARGWGGVDPDHPCAEGFDAAFGISRAEKKPTSILDCSYPADPGDMSLFRCDDGQGFGKTLQVVSSLGELAVDCDPPLGIRGGLGKGTEFTCSAPSGIASGDTHYRCAGYVLEEMGDDGWTSPVTNLDVSSFLYTHGDRAARLTWLYEQDGCRIDAVFKDPVKGAVSISPSPDLPGGYYSKGTEITITAEPVAGEYFTWWYGDLEDGKNASSPMAMTVERPLSIQAEGHPSWRYDAEQWTITDGNWVLYVTQNQKMPGELAIDGVKSVTCPEVLDLRSPVLDDDSGQYSISSIKGLQNRNIIRVLLPDTLRILKEGVFSGCGQLERVDPFIPDSVTKVEKDIFYNCTNLRGDLHINNPAVEEILYCTFWNCHKLDDAKIPHVTKLGPWAFGNCSSLTNIVLSENLVSMEQEAFSGCGELRYVTPFLPSTLVSMGDAAFRGCYKLEGDLKISVDSIPNNAFNNCRGLSSADLSKVSHIGDQAFENCWGLRHVVLSPSLVSIGEHAFEFCKTLQTVTPFFPSSLESIGANAFNRCSYLTGCVKFLNPDLLVVSDYVFGYCYFLEEAEMPFAEEIRDSAFWDCNAMTNVVLSPRLKVLEDWAFSSCDRLAHIKPFLPSSLTTLGKKVFEGSKVQEGALHLENSACTEIPEQCFNALGDGVSEVYLPKTRLVLDKPNAFFNLARGAKFYFTGLAPGPPFGEKIIGHDWGTRCTVYGSLRIDPKGWRALAEPLNEDDKKADDYPGDKTFGVWVVPGSPTRHWLVDWHSPFESKATVLMLR